MDVRRWVAAGLCVALLALAGCSDDKSEAKAQRPTNSAVSRSPSPTETGDAPSIPPEAIGTDEASAKAFASHYFELLSAAMSTGDTAAVADLSAADCQTCDSVSGRIENIYRKGGTLRTQGWRVEKFALDAATTPRRAYFLSVHQSKSVLLDDDQKVVSRTPATRVPMRIEMEPASGSWQVVRLDVVK